MHATKTFLLAALLAHTAAYADTETTEPAVPEADLLAAAAAEYERLRSEPPAGDATDAAGGPEHGADNTASDDTDQDAAEKAAEGNVDDSDNTATGIPVRIRSLQDLDRRMRQLERRRITAAYRAQQLARLRAAHVGLLQVSGDDPAASVVTATRTSAAVPAPARTQSAAEATADQLVAARQP